MFDWSDIRHFVVVARTGSALAAARELNSNQTTVSRRIERLEASLGVRLFDISPRGYILTRSGEELLALGQEMDSVAAKLSSQAARLVREVSGTIRFSGLVITMNMYGMPLMEMFRREHPNVFFEVDTRDSFASLEKGEVDVAMRSADVIEGDTLIARKIDLQPFAVYCSRDYADKYGVPRSLDECSEHKFVVYTDTLNRTNSCIRWMHERIAKHQVIFQVDSPPGMTVALKTGAGIGLLPRVMGEDDPDLIYCFGDPVLMHPIWIVASQESYATPLVRTFLKFFADNFHKVRRTFPEAPARTTASEPDAHNVDNPPGGRR